MSSSLRGNQPGFTSQGKTLCYLDIHEQIQKISGRHDDGGVEWDDVAFVQVQIQVGGQPLGEGEKKQKNGTLSTPPSNVLLCPSCEAPHPLEVVDDVSSVSVLEVWHRHVDELHLVPLQHPDPLFQQSLKVPVWHIHLWTAPVQDSTWSL